MTLKENIKQISLAAAFGMLAATASGMNPYLPLWEQIPDGEPYLFDDPDVPGRQRVYVYGSHDMLRDKYCGTDLVVWSASPDSLDVWRYDGVIFKSDKDANGRPLNGGRRPDVLYAPDVTVRTLPDGSKEYFLYPNNQEGGRNGQVARSSRPDGPFEVINWNSENPELCDGVLRFDPAVFIDDDGRVFGYWGFEKSFGAELDPVTMATVKKGTKIHENMIPGYKDGDGNVFRFFEASSIRKIDGKYVLIFSRMTENGEWGLPTTNYTLAYAYSDNPLGPWTYGGTIIDGRGRDTDADGKTIYTATPSGNTHGSIIRLGDQWWVFYHRQAGTDEYSRQAMVAPIEVKVEPGKGGKVYISEAEYTSEGFEIGGLDPLRLYPAAIASHYTGKGGAWQEYPRVHYTGPHFLPVYYDNHDMPDPYSFDINVNPVVNCTDGGILGYKYFNFDNLKGAEKVELALDLVPEGIDGTITVYTEAPWKGNPQAVGKFEIKASDPIKPLRYTADVTPVASLGGKHPLYLVFSTPSEGSLCTLQRLQFLK